MLSWGSFDIKKTNIEYRTKSIIDQHMDLNLPFSEDVAYRFDSLYQWLNRKYTIEHVDHEIAGASFRFFKIANIDEVLDTVVEELPETDENIPYWAELWPSALALAQY
ncbi:MAG: hypothetical protein GWN16_08145, partial [Calditrichae bacterium]|nr:hypothetical protein [Calditrichia bacterium]